MILLLPLILVAFALLIGWPMWHGPDEQFAMSPFERSLDELHAINNEKLCKAFGPSSEALWEPGLMTWGGE